MDKITTAKNSPLYKEDNTSTSVRFLTLQGKNWTSSRKINLGFDESYKYNVMKSYQVMTADFDIDKDKTSNASILPNNVLDSPELTGSAKIAHLLKPRQGTMYSELWTDYSNDNDKDYMVGGVWLLVPKDLQDYEAWEFGGFVRGQNPTKRNSIPEIVGKAIYKGSVAGLLTSLGDDDMVQISRLLGKVTLTADFMDGTKFGTLNGSVHDLRLDGANVGGSLLMNANMDDRFSDSTKVERSYDVGVDVGNIEGVNYTGSWHVQFQMPGATEADLPGGAVGTIGGHGTNGNTFIATFGAKKVEAE